MSITREQIIKRLQPVLDSCQEALDGEWDKSDDGFLAMEETLSTLIREIEREQEFLDYQGIDESETVRDEACPICGKKFLDFSSFEWLDGDVGFRYVNCNNLECQFEGKAWYRVVFSDWEDYKGNPVDVFYWEKVRNNNGKLLSETK